MDKPIVAFQQIVLVQCLELRSYDEFITKSQLGLPYMSSIFIYLICNSIRPGLLSYQPFRADYFRVKSMSGRI